MSRVAKAPVAIPAGVEVKLNGQEVTVKGSKGELTRVLNSAVVIAQEENKLIGAAQLRFHEMDIYPDREHWLGGVYVEASSRGQGVAERLIGAIINKAKALGVTSLNLQTEDKSGGLYTKLGWQAVEQVTYHGIKVLVMEKSI